MPSSRRKADMTILLFVEAERVASLIDDFS